MRRSANSSAIEEPTQSWCGVKPHNREAADAITAAHLALGIRCAVGLAKAAGLPQPSVTATELHAKHSDRYGVLVASRLSLVATSWAANATGSPHRLHALAHGALVCPRATM